MGEWINLMLSDCYVTKETTKLYGGDVLAVSGKIEKTKLPICNNMAVILITAWQYDIATQWAHVPDPDDTIKENKKYN